MGCGSSNVNSELHKRYNKKESNASTMPLKAPRSTFIQTEERRDDAIESTKIIDHSMKENLENFDLLSNFLKKPLVIKYFELIFKNQFIRQEYAEEFKDMYSVIREDFDALFKRWNIKYRIPKDAYTVNCVTYKLELSPSTNEDLNLILPLHFYELCLYPSSYIRKSKIEEFVYIHNLNFVTPEYSQYRAACPEYNYSCSMYYATKERSIEYIRLVLHHELFHYVDYTDDQTFEDLEWRKLNTPKFKYGNGGHLEREYKEKDSELKGFLNFYSTTGIEEDKAEIYQFLMLDPTSALNHEDIIIKKKANHLKMFLQKFDQIGVGDPNYFDCLSNLREDFY
jgi:hypothetical protein